MLIFREYRWVQYEKRRFNDATISLLLLSMELRFIDPTNKMQPIQDGKYLVQLKRFSSNLF